MKLDKKIEKYVLAVWETKRPIVDALISFANLQIESAAQVERVLNASELSADRAVSGYRRDQKILRRWLEKMVDWINLSATERSAILGKIRPWTEHEHASVRSQIVGDQLRRTISYGTSDVRHIVGDALYVLFEWGMVQEGGVAICPQCQSYFVKDRTDQEVCSNRCRQRKFRAKGAST